MRAYVINLDRRPDRLQRVTERFTQVGLSLTRFKAVDRETLEPAGDGDLVVGGLLANWKSHEELLGTIADGEDSHALILEDDAVPDPKVNWPLLFRNVAGAMRSQRIDFLQLGYVSWQYQWTRPGLLERTRLVMDRSTCASLSLDKERRIVLGSALAGAHAYVVSRSFAARVQGVNDPCWTGSDGLWMRMSTMSGWDARFPLMARLKASIVEQESRSRREAQLDTDVCN